MELDALQKQLGDFEALGASLIAISPQIPEKNAEIKNKHRLAFPVLSDPDHSWSDQLGLNHVLPADLKEVYKGFGIDLPAFNGNDTWQLPLAARFVIDSQGVIRSIEADADYTRRPEPDATLEVLRGLG